jgi:uncharacterized oxidoreductase
MEGTKMKLTGQTIFISGGGSGIGLALAKQLVKRGNEVIIVGRDLRRLEDAKLETPALHIYSCDISREEERLRLVDWLQSEHPALNVLFHNAGIQYHHRYELEPAPTLEAFQQEMDTNFTAAVRISALLLPLLMSKPSAAIINVTSGLAIAPKEGAPIYCASKAALSSFTRALRYQLETTPVEVYEAMAPLVDTAMTAGRGKGKISPDTFAREVIAGVESGKAVIHGGKVKWLYLLHRLAPSFTYRMMRRG